VKEEEEEKSGYVQQTFEAGVTAAAHSVPEADSAA
jgi:hypothetical protein